MFQTTNNFGLHKERKVSIMRIRTVLITLFVSVSLGCEMSLLNGPEASPRDKEIIIEDFDQIKPLNWRIVNDNVMGGVSKSSLRFNYDKTALFKGDVSLDNNGGFASARAYYGAGLDCISRISIRVKGDGQLYNFRVRTQESYWASYSISFQTIPDEWVEFHFQLSDFAPTYRGYSLNRMPSLDQLAIREIGFMIADKQEGEFNLSLDWIKAQ